MITLELSTRSNGGYSDASLVAHALICYNEDAFKTWEDLDDEEKKSNFPKMLQEVKVLSGVYAELLLRLTEQLQKNI